MHYSSFLGIDISKKKFNACLLIDNKQKHGEFDNNNDGFKNLLKWLEKIDATNFHACMESTSFYHEDLATFLYENDIAVSVVNAFQTKSFAKSEMLRIKTDKVDAASIARFVKANNPRLFKPQSKEGRSLRGFVRAIDSLKDQRRQLLNKLENERLSDFVKAAFRKIINEIDAQIKELETNMKEHVENSETLKEFVKCLVSIKGIGFLTACVVLSEIPDINSFKNAREFVAFCGLNPSIRQSGTSLNKRGRISKIGSSRLRKGLYMPAIVVKNHNEFFNGFCNCLREKKKMPKVIIVAVMRKLANIIFGMLKHKKVFNPDLAFGK